METKLDNGEVGFFDEAPWLVTNTRISWPNGVIRLSDVRSVEIVKKDKGMPLKIIGGILGIIALCIGLPFTVNVMANVCGFLLFIAAFWAFCSSTRFDLKLVVHCISGDVVLAQIEYPLESKTFDAKREKMKSIQDAISRAFVQSTASR